MPSSEPIGRLQDFLRRGGSVCPLAARSRVLYVLEGEMHDLRRELLMLSARESLAVVARVEPPDYAGVRSWAFSRFAEAFDVGLVLSSPGLTAASRMNMMLRVERDLRDPAVKTRPYVAVRGEPLVSICLSPVYPDGHPRHAPSTCLVMTWVEDVARVGEIPAVRAVMKERHGSLYDANELVLELPTSACAVGDGELGPAVTG